MRPWFLVFTTAQVGLIALPNLPIEESTSRSEFERGYFVLSGGFQANYNLGA